MSSHQCSSVTLTEEPGGVSCVQFTGRGSLAFWFLGRRTAPCNLFSPKHRGMAEMEEPSKCGQHQDSRACGHDAVCPVDSRSSDSVSPLIFLC